MKRFEDNDIIAMGAGSAARGEASHRGRKPKRNDGHLTTENGRQRRD
jgi:hypothetical protein